MYHVDELPAFARQAVLSEARRQVEAASANGLGIEWLVSHQKAVSQLSALFEREGIPITVKHFPQLLTEVSDGSQVVPG